MIQIKRLYKNYKQKNVYEDFSMEFEENQVTSILGPSGCGKTTLLRILAGLESYEKGEITGIADKKIAYVFQEDRLIPWMSVEENIAFVLKSYLDKTSIVERVKALLQMLQLLDYKAYKPHELSGGMQRRVALGRALAYDSEILLMDEPFKGLDTLLKEHILMHFKLYLQQNAKTVICVTHDIEEAEQLSHHICYLSKKS